MRRSKGEREGACSEKKSHSVRVVGTVRSPNRTGINRVAGRERNANRYRGWGVLGASRGTPSAVRRRFRVQRIDVEFRRTLRMGLRQCWARTIFRIGLERDRDASQKGNVDRSSRRGQVPTRSRWATPASPSSRSQRTPRSTTPLARRSRQSSTRPSTSARTRSFKRYFQAKDTLIGYYSSWVRGQGALGATNVNERESWQRNAPSMGHREALYFIFYF